MKNLLATALAAHSGTARILDAGGWFKPLARATHVLDLMPYETRRGVLAPAPLVGERFTRDTGTLSRTSLTRSHLSANCAA
jgi:hypothetical protein